MSLKAFVAIANMTKDPDAYLQGIDLGDDVMNNPEDLNVVPQGVKGSTLVIAINGKNYAYQPVQGMSVKDLDKKFTDIFKHSPGRALQWLKTNSQVINTHRQ